MIKVLHLFTTLDNGGVESFLYNYYSNMNHNEITFDFVVPGNKKGFLENKIEKMNSKIYHVDLFSEHPILQIRQLSNIIKNENYDVIHCHGYKSFIGIILGKIFKIPTRIIHSHMAFVKESFASIIIRKVITFIIKRCSTDFFACGIDAAKWLFGNYYYQLGKVKIINNAVDLEKFRYNINNRNNFREEMCCNDEILIGNVARLSKQKNQIYSLKIIKKLLDENINARLILIGNGEDEELLKYEAKRMGVEKKTIFLGIRSDINKLLSGLDIFILPSLYEGLPVVLAEVQASGLNCLVSNTVTEEIKVTDNIYYLSLDEDCSNWVNTIKKISKKTNYDRLTNYKKMKGGKYDIKYQADELYKFYYERVIGGKNE